MIISKRRAMVPVITAVVLASCGPAPASNAPAPAISASIPPASPAATSAAPTAAPASPSAAASQMSDVEWRAAGHMTTPRTGFDAVVLGGSTVLAVGDDFACYPGPAAAGSETAERYDPAADAWTAAPSLNKPRKEPATVVLPDGAALVVGGLNDADQPFSSTKRFDPGAGTWADGPLMNLGRERPLAVSLAAGGVFVVSETQARFTSELLDPSTGTWRTTASLPSGARIDDMVALRGGTILAVGSDMNGSEGSPAAYQYDPGVDGWTAVGGLARSGYELVAAADGAALAIGGNVGGAGDVTARVDRFDPAAASWAEVAAMTTPRTEAQIVVLPKGGILVAGGSNGDSPTSGHALTSTEVYDPAANRWIPGTDLLEPRYGGHALAFENGSVLLLGGANDFNTEGDTPWCPTPLVTTERLSTRP